MRDRFFCPIKLLNSDLCGVVWCCGKNYALGLTPSCAVAGSKNFSRGHRALIYETGIKPTTQGCRQDEVAQLWESSWQETDFQ